MSPVTFHYISRRQTAAALVIANTTYCKSTKYTYSIIQTPHKEADFQNPLDWALVIANTTYCKSTKYTYNIIQTPHKEADFQNPLDWA